ncbi:hypothetical protein [Photobacterium angustum]|nr:hypothetical protein [Photobacterium angustum]
MKQATEIIKDYFVKYRKKRGVIIKFLAEKDRIAGKAIKKIGKQ